MDLITKLTHSSLDPALLAQVVSALTTSSAEATQLSRALQNEKLLNQALKLELALHKRIRFGVKTEALNAEQRELLEETWSSDLAELEQRVDALEPRPHGPKPVGNRCQTICLALNIATNRCPAPVSIAVKH